jgi:hypothetical protein
MIWVAVAVLLLIDVLLVRFFMALQDDVNTLTARITEARDRIVARIGELEAAVANGQTVDLSGLQAAADALDQVAPS